MTPNLLRQTAIQGTAAFTVLSLLWPYHGFAATPYQWPLVMLAIGIAAGAIASIAGQAWWWRLIHFVFAPLAWSVAQLDISPGWFLLAFLLLLAAFRGVIVEQVPLYLSGTAARQALADLIAERRCDRFLDLGAGIGSMLVPLAKEFPGCHFVGVENSPIPWLIGWFRSRGLRNVDWRWASLWNTDLSSSAIVYAFLSPVPMPMLGEKAAREMHPEALLVSNSFPIPDRSPSGTRAAGGDVLYLYTAQALKPPPESSTTV